jgi:sporulation protein YlmC with PRC-barrel domain
MADIEELHAGATAVATDGKIGIVVALVIDPAAAAITHLVVRNADVPASGRLISIDHVIGTSTDRVQLDLSRAQILAADHFIIPGRLPAEPPSGAFATYWLGPAGGRTFAVHEQLPHDDELAVRAKPPVRSRDGHHIGSVAEVLIDPVTGAITHLLLRHGHLFGRREVIIPVSAIASIDHDGVRLNLDRSVLDSLPTAGKA